MPIALSNGHVEATGDDIIYPPSGHDESSMDIAIIGMACRLPGHVSNLQSFWDLCLTARDTWSEVPKERFSQEHFYHPNPDQTNCVSPKSLQVCQNKRKKKKETLTSRIVVLERWSLPFRRSRTLRRPIFQHHRPRSQGDGSTTAALIGMRL